MSYTFSTYETLALASLVLLLGYFLVKRINVLKHLTFQSQLLVALLLPLVF